eukprot:CAMPEP_0176321174 /NCGR_PEP_ID=MMETSP0121_2-20121125/71209_1 /TAXON_ID=160619 /ORGANISM="Kryptoperidinium foliaceum, Strain CCMP 1326" /LENGTH=60 /DNA_ID=CAMNT_0017663601 /DNA_START=10 /DNA_END=188 /DNA_ORIENTATION=+
MTRPRRAPRRGRPSSTSACRSSPPSRNARRASQGGSRGSAPGDLGAMSGATWAGHVVHSV